MARRQPCSPGPLDLHLTVQIDEASGAVIQMVPSRPTQSSASGQEAALGVGLQLVDYSLGLILAVTLVSLVVASEIGRWAGRLARTRSRDNVATIEGAILGLLALIAGFTFALGLSRFEEKRAAILAEANSIGTAALRSQLLPAPYSAETLRLLETYLEIRLDPDLTGPQASVQDVTAAMQRSNVVQEALWRQAQALAAEDDRMVPTGLFIQSLNDLFDNQEARLVAIASGIANVVLFALHGIALVAVWFVGYASGIEQKSSRVPTYTMIVLFAGVLLIIHDLDRPRQGFITTDLQPLRNVAKSIAAQHRE